MLLTDIISGFKCKVILKSEVCKGSAVDLRINYELEFTKGNYGFMTTEDDEWEASSLFLNTLPMKTNICKHLCIQAAIKCGRTVRVGEFKKKDL